MSEGQSTNLTQWARFNRGGHPDYVGNDGLDLHLIWCVWHEGVLAYSGSVLRPIDSLRQECMRKQGHNQAARALIESASNNQLRTELTQMQEYFGSPPNGGYKMIQYHLSWVANHEGRRSAILKARDANDFASIRSIYVTEQSHNPHVKNLLSAVSDQTLGMLVDDL